MDIFPLNMYSNQHTKTYISQQKMTTAEFDRIFDLYYKRVYKYICYRINNQHMAEDLCSQVFERVVSKYATFNREKSSFEVWLFAIVRNIITDYYRSSKKLFHIPLDSTSDQISPNPSPEENLIAKDENKELFAALGKLREKERNIIAMKFAASLKNAEIAELLGISSSNVGVVLYRSLKKLRDFLDEGGFNHD
ncbi:sigma-70 family RNA polymerase sigma factor [Desulfitobacterium chlororespirans]|uniref:RNA polymerase sigma-70 factor, ECF subfamily n=1 Tax=Desulfitobacterium chlororespirans DSM 11544 TaxID=1121395 RepID=A0A1M7SPX2_9FIRM|nr:sigma-70 family RNA polymerase sigma factor [Desulfitobacterium chlororespirans]SHN60512.1 RNA polymerase sigma-70 factor, ECF subfamily [Desulfitobacterium chlororespirans DSM 11544]